MEHLQDQEFISSKLYFTRYKDGDKDYNFKDDNLIQRIVECDSSLSINLFVLILFPS